MTHLYKLNGYNIVLDTASGSVHSVDDVAYDAISMYNDCSKQQIAEFITSKYPDVSEADVEDVLADVAELKADGKLFSEDKYSRTLTRLPNAIPS